MNSVKFYTKSGRSLHTSIEDFKFDDQIQLIINGEPSGYVTKKDDNYIFHLCIFEDEFTEPNLYSYDLLKQIRLVIGKKNLAIFSPNFIFEVGRGLNQTPFNHGILKFVGKYNSILL